MAFLEDAIKAATDNCIIWPFSKNPLGYGNLRVNYKTKRAHNFACSLAHGPKPTKTEAAHSCGVRLCVNPRHLRWATREDNQADRVAHGTSNRGVRQWKARLTETNVRAIRALIRKGVSRRDIAARYLIGLKTISDIHTGKTWFWLD